MTRTTGMAFVVAAAMAAWSLAAAQPANALDYDDIAGKWCGETTTYTFERRTLRVYWPSDGARKSFTVTEYAYDDDEITVHWRKDGETVFTVFGNFRGDRMVQKPNENGPRRPFRRC